MEGAELEEKLLQPATTTPPSSVHVPARKQPAQPIPRKRTTEYDELVLSFILTGNYDYQPIWKLCMCMILN